MNLPNASAAQPNAGLPSGPLLSHTRPPKEEPPLHSPASNWKVYDSMTFLAFCLVSSGGAHRRRSGHRVWARSAGAEGDTLSSNEQHGARRFRALSCVVDIVASRTGREKTDSLLKTERSYGYLHEAC